MSPQETRKWYRSTGALLTFHSLAWLILLLLPAALHRDADKPTAFDWKSSFNFQYVLILCTFAAVFYLNAFVLIPRLLTPKHIGAYVGSVILLISTFILIGSRIPSHDGHARSKAEYWFMIFPYLFYWAMSTAYRFFFDQVKTEQQLKERENSNLKTELSFLRSQISPHFLFNVLNNMVAMARLKSEKLEPSLIRLSGLMRYMLYESDVSKVSLSRELEYVESYIELQKLRYDSSLRIIEHLDVKEDALIEPMLLIPFIENAFKHGTGMILDPVIEITLTSSADQLQFIVKNTYFEGETSLSKDKVSGIGLVNVQRRLNLLYAGQHQLVIDRADGCFSVCLTLNLHTV